MLNCASYEHNAYILGPVEPTFYAENAASSSTPNNPDVECRFPRNEDPEDQELKPGQVVYECGPCEQGYYCGGGRGIMSACPRGTYGNRGGLQFSGQCLDCPPGSYCVGTARTNTSGLCSPGYYCNGSSQSPNPDGTEPWGGECSPGHFCPEGSPFERPCLAGTYANISGKAECDECPAGFYCPEMSISPQECEPGYFCRNGTGDYTQNECERGTFNNETRGETPDDCIQCPVGEYY